MCFDGSFNRDGMQSEQKYMRLDLYRRRQPLTTAHGRLLHRAA